MERCLILSKQIWLVTDLIVDVRRVRTLIKAKARALGNYNSCTLFIETGMISLHFTSISSRSQAGGLLLVTGLASYSQNF